MPISYNRFLKGLKKSKHQIYLFNGDENFLKDSGVLSIIEKYKGKYDEDFDFFEYYGKDTNSEELSSELYTTPMIDEYRLIIIHNIDKCDIKSKNVIKKWLDEPNEFIIFVSTTSEQISLNGKNTTQFFKKLSEIGSTVTCYKLEEPDMREWIIEKLKEYNKRIDDNSIEYMIDMVGMDLYKMNNELKKVMFYIKDRDIVLLEDVNNVVFDVRTDNIFDLVDYIVSKDLKTSLKMAKNVIRESGDAIALISLLYRKLMQGSIIIEMDSKSYSDNDIMTKLSISSYGLKKSREKIGQISKINIFNLFRELLDIDIKLKNSPISFNDVINDLIIKVCS